MEEAAANQEPQAFGSPIVYHEGEEEPEDPNALPTGFTFCPTDEELINDFLIPKIRRRPLLCEGRVIEANVYDQSPRSLIAEYGDMMHEGVLYVFTPRNQKYKKGSQPDRTAVGGYWMATSGDKPILADDRRTKIGAKKQLRFVERKLDGGKMNTCFMVEYVAEESPVPATTQPLPADGRWRLDEYLLCKIYQSGGLDHPPNEGADSKHEVTSFPCQIEQPEHDSTPSQIQQPKPSNQPARHVGSARSQPEASNQYFSYLPGTSAMSSNWNQIPYPTVGQINFTGQLDPSMPYQSGQLANITSRSSPSDPFAFTELNPPLGYADPRTSDPLYAMNLDADITNALLAEFPTDSDSDHDDQQSFPYASAVSPFQYGQMSANQFPAMQPGPSMYDLPPGPSSMPQFPIFHPGPSLYGFPPPRSSMPGPSSMPRYPEFLPGQSSMPGPLSMPWYPEFPPGQSSMPGQPSKPWYPVFPPGPSMYDFPAAGGGLLNEAALTALQRDHRDVPDSAIDAFSCNEFMMYEFKVRRCTRDRSHNWTECPYAHPGETARRRDPRNYSGTACPDFRKGSCKRGDSCDMAHGVFEGWLHPTRYRTQPCIDGNSCRRRVCFFAHTVEQLRVLPQSGNSPRDSYDGFLRLPATPTRAVEHLGFGGEEEEEAHVERVESGRPLRARLYERLSKESGLERVEPAVGSAARPDVGWVSKLQQSSIFPQGQPSMPGYYQDTPFRPTTDGISESTEGEPQEAILGGRGRDLNTSVLEE